MFAYQSGNVLYAMIQCYVQEWACLREEPQFCLISYPCPELHVQLGAYRQHRAVAGA